MAEEHESNAIHWFLGDLTSRIIAESGIPSDRSHLGKILLRSFQDYPDSIAQIDGGTGESVTYASMLEKSVTCAKCFRKLGLGPGDVIVLMSANHITLSVPFYAALYIGITISVVDSTFGLMGLQNSFQECKPNIIFCQSEKVQDIQTVLKEIDLSCKLVTFDKSNDVCSFDEFIQQYNDNSPIEDFKPTDFDPETTTAFLLSTSGSTGTPKTAETLHKNLVIALSSFWSRSTTFPSPTKIVFCPTPFQWFTTIYSTIVYPILKMTKLHTSMSLTQEHAYYLINTYKPTLMLSSALFIKSLIDVKTSKLCDFSCFDYIVTTGYAASKEFFEHVKSVIPKAEVLNAYGLTEVCGMCFYCDALLPESCGKPLGNFQYRLVDIETQEDIDKPNVPGELWIKGPSVFKGYYNNIEATKETFAEDGWLKTGDMFYRNENWNFFYVERIKLLMKYNDDQISPIELENVIKKHPGVQDVGVTSVPESVYGDLLVACVVRKEGSDVTADDIKNLVKESLCESRQLRGGVVFLESIPVTSSYKVNQKKLKEIALTSKRL